MSGRDELLSAGAAAFGGAPVLHTEGLKNLRAIAAWRVSSEPVRWLLMSMGNSMLEVSAYRYDYSGHGFELLCEVEGETVPSGMLALLDFASAAAQGVASEGALLKPRKLAKCGRIGPSTRLAPLDTPNGVVKFVDLLPESPEGLVTRAERLFAAARSLARPAVMLTKESEGSSRSHSGGTAMLPAAFVWPRHEGIALPLLLELDLSELPVDPFLPTTGRLLLFGPPHDAHRHFEVRYVDGPGEQRTDGDPQPSFHLKVARFDDLPAASQLRQHALLRGVKGALREETLAGYAALRAPPRGQIQVLGWHHSIQDDVVVEALLDLHQLRPPLGETRYAQLEEEAQAWLVLLQLSSDAEWDFCGGGELYVVGHRDDIQAGRFECTRAVLQR
jgi:Domain of unknown function (DUF1963)